MSWIKMQNSLRSNPKLVRIMLRCGVTKVTALGGICNAWMVADEHADVSGVIDRMDFEEFDLLVEVPGMAKAMESVGWLEANGDGIVFPDYSENNGSTAKTRAQTQKRVAASRKRNGAALPDGNQRRGEEIREEEKREDTHPESASFIDVVQLWPKQSGQREGMLGLKQSVDRGESLAEIIAKTRACAEAVRKAHKNPAKNRYVLTAKSFFENERWQDDPETFARTDDGRGPSSDKHRQKSEFGI